MEGANSIAALSSNIDSLGTNFTAATYGVFAYYLTPVMAALFTLYLIFWGFRFWQGQGGSIVSMVFKLVRIAIIFSLVTAWGPFQVALYGLFTNAPYMVSSVMLNHIVNPRSGKAMGFSTLANDLNAVYGFALTASAKIEQSAVAAAAPLPQPVSEEGSPPNPAKSNPIAQSKSPVDSPLTVPLSSSVQAAIIWIAAALFVGYAVALLLFAKVALWIMLALAPFFIVLLMFQIPSRYFSGWLTGTIQIILIPIFLTTFLSFYNIGIQDVVKALVLSIAKGSVPAMKDAGPFVLVCLTGFFCLPRSCLSAAELRQAARNGSPISPLTRAMPAETSPVPWLQDAASEIPPETLQSLLHPHNFRTNIRAKRICARCKTEMRRSIGKAETDSEFRQL